MKQQSRIDKVLDYMKRHKVGLSEAWDILYPASKQTNNLIVSK